MVSPKRYLKALNSYEQLALLRQPNPKAPTGIRNLCILSLMLKLGLRVSEVINLGNNDIDWENGKIHVRESGAARERTLWIDQAELTLLKKWRQVKTGSSDLFFTTLDDSRLKDRYIREMVKRLAFKAGIDQDVYPHLLRYTFAAEMMKETNDIKLLQEALGHRDISATRIYTNMIIDQEKDISFSGIAARRSGVPVLVEEQGYFSIATKTVSGQSVIEAEPKEMESGEQEGINADMYKKDGYNKKTYTDRDPLITVVADKDNHDNIAIPAIKCSNCNYILRFQGDCPKCGTAFAAILKHWGRYI
jgi:hypothetical protein